jgi:hypothetical protein
MTGITPLDFDQIKESLKTFLKGQDRFKDYDFEGSNMSVMLDILAYNTFQNAFYKNMAINEAFLDTAQLRETVVSHAKTLNYTPRSRKSSRAFLNVVLTVPNSPPFVVIPAKTQFNANLGGKNYTFTNQNAVTVRPTNGVYSAIGVEVSEGKFQQEIFDTRISTRYILSNKNVDTSSIRVFIRATEQDTAETEYTFDTTIFGNSPDSTVFYVQAANDIQYELVFGKNSFGKEPEVGNIIRVEYRITSGTEANGITQFTPTSTIGGYSASITVNKKSEGGAEQEDIESVRFFAPRYTQLQDRAITEGDYQILLKQRFPEIQAVSVFGGDELVPPRFGRVVIAVDTASADGVSETNRITYTNFLKERMPLSIEPIITNPDFIFLEVTSHVRYNSKRGSLSAGDLAVKVTDNIVTYVDQNLKDFKSVLRFSRLSSIIDSSDQNILSNDLEIRPILLLTDSLLSQTRIDILFGNELEIGPLLQSGKPIGPQKTAIESSPFVYKNQTVFLIDDGDGNIHIVKSKDNSFVFVERNAGRLFYDNGRVILSKLNVQSYSGDGIKLYGRTKKQLVESRQSRLLRVNHSDINITVIG